MSLGKPAIVKCRSCPASIVWMWTKNSKKMPVNADSLADTDDRLTEFDPKRHMTHYATCPQAKKWTRKGKRYPDSPGYKRDGTSKEAAAAASGSSEEVKRLILADLRNGEFTTDEIADHIGIKPAYCRPRCSELVTAGRIDWTGERRPNASSGLSAGVLRLVGSEPKPAGDTQAELVLL